MDNRGILRRNIETQGFTGLNDEALVALDPWLRLMPFLTCLTVALSTLMEAPMILAGCAVITLAGAVLPRHPVEMVYQGLIRNLESSPSLPPTPGRRRLVLLLWSAAMAAGAYCFWMGRLQWGFMLGWSTAAVIGMLASHQLCLISELIQFVMPGQGKAGRNPDPDA